MDVADHNFACSINVFASTSKTGEVLEARDFVLGNTKAPIAEFNQGYLKQPNYKLERTLERVQAYYARSGVPHRLHVSSEHAALGPVLLARGYVESKAVPCMVLAGARCEAKAVPGLHIERVAGAASLAQFQRLAFESFGYPVMLAPVALTEDLVGLPHAELFIGMLDGEPACCSMLLVTGDTAGVYWVGALAAHRQKGLGAAITAHAVEAGRARGCKTACLQASEMGAPVYRRLGFVEPRKYLRFDHA
jgi:GNAT superfamily N-acetyltransferase